MDRSQTVETVLERFGTTFVEQAKIPLKDKPSPLYQLLVLSHCSRHELVRILGWPQLRNFRLQVFGHRSIWWRPLGSSELMPWDGDTIEGSMRVQQRCLETARNCSSTNIVAICADCEMLQTPPAR